MKFSRVLALVVSVVGVLAGGAGVSVAATPTTPYAVKTVSSPAPEVKGRWAERLRVAGDLNGDGVQDIWVADLHATVNGLTAAGRVYLLSGKDFSVLRTINPPQPQAGTQFGFFINVVGDVNGDGKPDLAVGTDAQNVFTGFDDTGAPNPAPCGAPEPNGCNEKQGRVYVFSGADSSLLYTLDNPNPQGSPSNSARFGSRLSNAGDINGDGVPDVIVGASGNDVCSPGPCTPAPPPNTACGDISPLPTNCRVNQGQAFIFEGGGAHQLLRTIDLPDPDRPAGKCSDSCGSFGLAVQSPGDVNGDGVPDQLIDAGSYSYDNGPNGATGPSTACDPPSPGPTCMVGQGRMYLFDGKTGALIRRIDDPAPQTGATFGFQDVTPFDPGDVNGDGVPDIYANGFGQDGPRGLSGAGRAWVFSGKTGGLLYEVFDSTPELGAQFGWSETRTDYNGDGIPDLYIGKSPHHTPGAVGSGGTEVFNGIDGSPLRVFGLPASDVQPSTPSNLGPNLGWTVAAPGDLNGDGQPDYLGGAPFFDSASNQDEGRLYAFTSVPPGGTPGALAPVVPGTQVNPLATVSPLTVALSVSRRRFRLGSKLPQLARVKVGTTIRFVLPRPALTQFVFTTKRAGRRVGGVCRVPTRSNRARRHCQRTVVVGSFEVKGRQGLNQIAFQGRLSASQRLKLGRYTMTATAVDNGGRSRPSNPINLQIVRR